MSAFDALVGDKWGSGATAEEAVNDAFDRWCDEDDEWFDSQREWVAEVYEGALFATTFDPDHENGFVLARWTRKGRAEITADEDDQPVLGEIVWREP